MIRSTAILVILLATGAPGDEPAARPVPTLDELLGLVEPGDQPQKEGVSGELDRLLSPDQARDAFAEAAGLMGDAAARLAGDGDVGLGTQRLQSDILAKLDRVIEAAEQNNGQSPSGSPSPDQQPSPSSQPNQPQQSQGSTPGQGDNQGDNMPGASSGASPSPNAPATGVAWGALPQRLRGVLMQGVGERYSSLYERMTEQYYKKLAEDRDQ